MIQIKLREVKMMINHYLIEKYGAEQFDKFQRDHNGKQTVLDFFSISNDLTEAGLYRCFYFKQRFAHRFVKM